MTEMPDLGAIIMNAFAQLPGTLAGWIADDPGPWILVGLMMLGLVTLSVVSRRRRRR